ncbi:epidermis-specific secreted glycoprotein EP1-like isoform X1 [Benincasa hispida]|uniref:epidermis-specific secreted glycoprotein EP1-like isoform X1 n=1 Tax=Benincasa hispida TaxID=102211 RepID=UPI0019006C4D|nr:epidermis-specific secreted glycoprotein EP1-like isoform X1 [Benincasa hispida]
MRPTLLTPLLLSFFFLFISLSLALVPPNETFRFVNEGDFGDFAVEYDATYRPLSISNSPFQLMFYNTTPNAYTLALRMAILRSESAKRWVWEANRGRPVRENATFSLGADGNLILAEADGTVVWQSNTANKGVVRLELLPNGNMVLIDSNGKFVWQSFDSPTDTLLVGQSLRLGGAMKLVSRASEKSNVNGPYSFVMERKALALYYKSPNSPKPMRYFASSNWFTIQKGTLSRVTLNAEVEPDQGFATELNLNYEVAGSTETGGTILTRPKYNSTLTFLRLGIDGNVRLFTYNDKVDWGPSEISFTLFDRESNTENECQWPERCGQLGVCEENQCVACPTEKGLLGWSKMCMAKKVSSCDPKSFHYYKLEGVDHFLTKYNKGEGPMGQKECEKKCNLDCKCLGYFYQTRGSLCWVANELKTLIKVDNSTHLGFIKTPNM